MKYLRYKGEFISLSGVVWRAEILQEAEAEFDTVGDLDFDADEPIVIEWGKKSKEEVICGSTATVKIISPGDRTYEDLYSIDVGRVRLDVYRNNALYWCGCIDTEFYEEPYERLNGYTVTLSFTDFGVLDRLCYDLSGGQTIYDLVSYCIDKSGIEGLSLHTGLISTSLPDTIGSINLRHIQVRSDNFYDEDDEALTIKEVIEGVLQPLSLRMIQRAGSVYIYDLNGLFSGANKKQIIWRGDSQTMGVDVVYNNAKITWSPYVQEGNLAPENCWGSIETDPTLTALNLLSGKSINGATYFSYHLSNSLSDWDDATDVGFTLWTAEEGENAELGKGARFFKIVPQYDGQEDEGLALQWNAFAKTIDANRNEVLRKLPYGAFLSQGSPEVIGWEYFKSGPIWLPPIKNADKFCVRIAIDMLMDPRFNPFESAANLTAEECEKDWYDQYSKRGNFVYVPVAIKFKPEGLSNDIYIWSNQYEISLAASLYPLTHFDQTMGKWVACKDTANPETWGYLCYYDAKDHVDNSGVLGWKKNRPGINPHTQDLDSQLVNVENGQYIPYPPCNKPGKLWIEVLRKSWQIIDAGKDFDVNGDNTEGLLEKANWILMKLPEIEVMNLRQFGESLNTDDVEYNAQINDAAKEPIEIDTICGTSTEEMPTARGAYYKVETGEQITQLTRAGRTTQVEDLLIGTLYSQFAQRRITLSGEAQLLEGGVFAYTEDNQGNKLFMVMEDIQDVREDTSEAIFVELRPDEYKRSNE